MDKKAALRLGVDIASFVFPQIHTVETIAKTLPGLKGKAKEDASVALAHELLSGFEDLINKDLLNDAEVDAAVRGVIQAVVALQNVLVTKS